MKDPWDHGHDDSEFRDDFGKWIGDTMKAANPRDFIDPAKMAERKEITDARIEGFTDGYKKGSNVGLAFGIAGMVLLIALVRIISAVAG